MRASLAQRLGAGLATRVRSETTIGQGQVSVPSVAVDLARQISAICRQIRDAGGLGRDGGNRRQASCAARARRVVRGRAQPSSAPKKSHEAWTVKGGLERAGCDLGRGRRRLTCTSAKGYVHRLRTVAAARKKARAAEPFLIDLAVPRDIDPRVEKPAALLYNVAISRRRCKQSLSARSREAERAEATSERGARLTIAGRRRASFADRRCATSAGAAALEVERTAASRRLRHLGLEERGRARKNDPTPPSTACCTVPTRKLRQAATERAAEALSLEQLVSAVGELFELSQPASLAG